MFAFWRNCNILITRTLFLSRKSDQWTTVTEQARVEPIGHAWKKMQGTLRKPTATGNQNVLASRPVPKVSKIGLIGEREP